MLALGTVCRKKHVMSQEMTRRLENQEQSQKMGSSSAGTGRNEQRRDHGGKSKEI